MQQTFNMAATAEAFNILSSSLYSNPKLAIIRELSTNANDAHKQAGKEDYPFNLHLPTPSEPFFNIRDYGDGIPEDLIYNIFTSYFVSTKTEDENQTGCFGLGSKTPFSLVDEYEVISYCEGKKKTYKMSKKNGLPCVEKIAEEDWTKDTGLEINFKWSADREWQYEEWNNEANNFFRGTSFLPNVNTFNDNPDFNWDDFMKDRDFHSFNSIEIEHSYHPNICINVAGVNFDVDYRDLRAKGEALKETLQKAGVKRINIVANKSDVTLTPSREVLHYDDKTVDFICKNVLKVIDEYYKKINDKFDEYNYADALKLQKNQSYDIDLNDKFRTKIFNTFFSKTLDVRCNGKGKSISVVSPNEGASSTWRPFPEKIYLVDFNGIKSTVKQNVVDNFVSLSSFDDKGKLTSVSFADVIKRIDASGKDYRVLFPRNYKDAANLQACKDFLGENVEVVKWATACEYKKEAGNGRKLGFKTRQTITYDNNSNYHYGYINSPDLADDEIGVLVPEGTDVYEVRNKAQVLKDLGLTFKIVARPCKDSVFKKYKEKGFLALDEYVKSIVDANIDTIKSEIEIAKKNEFVRCISYCYEADLAAVFNDPVFDPLMDIEDFKNIRELYKEENFTTKFHNSFTNVKNIDGITEYNKPFFEDFPLFGRLSIYNHEDWRNFLNYALLYKDSIFFQNEKKTDEEVA